MLTPEDAKKELEQHRDPEALKSLTERLHALPSELGAIGLAFLESLLHTGIEANRQSKSVSQQSVLSRDWTIVTGKSFSLPCFHRSQIT